MWTLSSPKVFNWFSPKLWKFLPHHKISSISYPYPCFFAPSVQKGIGWEEIWSNPSDRAIAYRYVFHCVHRIGGFWVISNLHWNGSNGGDGEVVILDHSVEHSLKEVARFNVVDHVMRITWLCRLLALYQVEHNQLYLTFVRTDKQITCQQFVDDDSNCKAVHQVTADISFIAQLSKHALTTLYSFKSFYLPRKILNTNLA